MNHRVRLVVFGVAGAAIAAVLAWSFVQLPHFGGAHHPYRDVVVAAAADHRTANTVSSVNFDSRGLDTLGEETILLASAVGVVALLRLSDEERREVPPDPGRLLDVVSLAAPAMLPIALLTGATVAVHGHLSPGGGFQAGLLLATAAVLLYVGGRYSLYERVASMPRFEVLEVVDAGAFALVGVAGLAFGDGFLANFLPHGRMGQLVSGGTVPVLNLVVALEVTASIVVVWAAFLEQEVAVRPRQPS